MYKGILVVCLSLAAAAQALDVELFAGAGASQPLGHVHYYDGRFGRGGTITGAVFFPVGANVEVGCAGGYNLGYWSKDTFYKELVIVPVTPGVWGSWGVKTKIGAGVGPGIYFIKPYVDTGWEPD
jgi:hypothetical protein